MAWLVASNEQDFVNAVLKHYTSGRRDVPDAHLLRRAALSAEFALAQYLVKGLAAGDQDMIHEAESMLTVLADDVAEHGGQPISVEPLPQPVAAPGPGSRLAPDATAVPAVSKVTLLAPEPAPGPAASPASSAVPAVHVTPIPLDTDGGGAATDGAADDASQEDDAAADDAHDNGVAPKDGAADDAPEENAPEDEGVSAAETADDAPPEDDAATDRDGGGAAEDTSTQSIAVVQADSADDTATTSISVVQAKFP
jgi:hypothetical protein